MTTELTREVTLTDQNFARDVLASDKPTLVDFWAEWCGPCQVMNPVIRELAVEYQDQLKVGKVNVDEQPDTAARYRVQSIPTLILFHHGREADRIIGAVPKKVLAQRIGVVLSNR